LEGGLKSILPTLAGSSRSQVRSQGVGEGYAVLRGEKAPDDALARGLGAMGLL
jgi:hypothetical protein